MKNLKVVHEGDAKMVDFPFVINKSWVIPSGWYLLDNIIDDINITSVKSKEEILSVFENIQILEKNEGIERKLSIIKTDKKLKEGDIIEL